MALASASLSQRWGITIPSLRGVEGSEVEVPLLSFQNRRLSGVETSGVETSGVETSGVETGLSPLLEIPAMSFIHTLSVFFESLRHMVNQGFFFASTPSLYLLFTIKRLINTTILLKIHQFHRKPFFRIVGTLPQLMLRKSPFQIGSTPRVITPISTFQDIHIPFHKPFAPLITSPVPLQSHQSPF
jgi:hypothetical protein